MGKKEYKAKTFDKSGKKVSMYFPVVNIGFAKYKGKHV